MAIVDSNKLNFARSTLKKDKTFTINKLVSILECSSRTAQAKLNLLILFIFYLAYYLLMI